MPVPFLCPACNLKKSLPDTYAGKKIKCKCGQVVSLPVPPPVAPLEEADLILTPLESDPFDAPVQQAAPVLQRAKRKKVKRKRPKTSKAKTLVHGETDDQILATRLLGADQERFEPGASIEDEEIAWVAIVTGGPVKAFISFVMGLIMVLLGLFARSFLGQGVGKLEAYLILAPLIFGAMLLGLEIVGVVYGLLSRRVRSEFPMWMLGELCC